MVIYENDGTCVSKANLALSMFKHDFSVLFELHTFDLEKKKGRYNLCFVHFIAKI